MANIPKALEPSFERSATLVASYQPDADLTALMERYRTGPFRPVPQLYESVAHDESDVVFGIDLRKWAEGGWEALTSGEEKKELIPPVLTAMLNALDEAYGRLQNDTGEWILSRQSDSEREISVQKNGKPGFMMFHFLWCITSGRLSMLFLQNNPSRQRCSANMMLQCLQPVLSCGLLNWIRLSLFGMDGMILGNCILLVSLHISGRMILRLITRLVGSSKAVGEPSEQQHLQDLQAALQRLPRVNLYVLDAIISHLRRCVFCIWFRDDLLNCAVV